MKVLGLGYLVVFEKLMSPLCRKPLHYAQKIKQVMSRVDFLFHFSLHVHLLASS